MCMPSSGSSTVRCSHQPNAHAAAWTCHHAHTFIMHVCACTLPAAGGSSTFAGCRVPLQGIDSDSLEAVVSARLHGCTHSTHPQQQAAWLFQETGCVCSSCKHTAHNCTVCMHACTYIHTVTSQQCMCGHIQCYMHALSMS